MSNTTKTTNIEAVKPEAKAGFVTVPVVAAVVAKVAPEVKAVPETKAAVASSAVATAVAPVVAAESSRTAVAALVARLRSPEAELARDAATMLGSLPADTQSVDGLIEVVRNKDGFFHSVVRAAAAQALGRLADRRSVDALIEAMRDPMAETSEEAVKALGLLGDVKAVPALNAVVANTDGYFLETVRKAAAGALERLKPAKKA